MTLRESHELERAKIPIAVRRSAGPLAFALFVGAFFGLAANQLAFTERSHDEGMFLMQARLMATGFNLYSDIPVLQPPLLVEYLRAVFARVGESVEAGRIAVLVVNCIALVAVGAIARSLRGWWAALAAMAFLVLSPMFFSLARAVMTSLPAAALATAALAAAMAYRATDSAHRARVIATFSGLLFGLGLMVKPIGVPLLVPIVILAIGRRYRLGAAPAGRPTWAAFYVDAALWVVSAALPVVWGIWRYGWRDIFETVVGFMTSRGAFSLDLTGNIQKVFEWLAEGHMGLAALGLFGVAYALPRAHRRDGWASPWWAIAAWVGTNAVATLVQAPLWEHHLVLLVLPLAVTAGIGLFDGGSLVLAALRALLRSTPRPPTEGWLAFAAIALVVTGLALPGQVRMLAESTEVDDDGEVRAIEMLGHVAQPGDFIIADSPMLAFRAGLRVPPALSELSLKRRRLGLFSAGDVSDATLQFRPVAVLTWQEHLTTWWDGGYPRWLHDNGWRVSEVIEERAGRWLYLPPQAPPTPTTEVNVQFSDGLVLGGFRLPQTEFVAGEPLPVYLFWRADGAVIGDHRVCVRLVDPASGAIVAMAEDIIARGVRPADRWLPDETVVDGHLLGISSSQAPGQYVVRVGLYDHAKEDAPLSVRDPGSLGASAIGTDATCGRAQSGDEPNAIDLLSVTVAQP